MISDSLTTICNFLKAMKDSDNGYELRINEQNTEYVIAVLQDAADRVRCLECQIVPPPVAETTVTGNNVVSIAQFRANNTGRKAR